jgi:hypothetical protein
MEVAMSFVSTKVILAAVTSILLSVAASAEVGPGKMLHGYPAPFDMYTQSLQYTLDGSESQIFGSPEFYFSRRPVLAAVSEANSPLYIANPPHYDHDLSVLGVRIGDTVAGAEESLKKLVKIDRTEKTECQVSRDAPSYPCELIYYWDDPNDDSTNILTLGISSPSSGCQVLSINRMWKYKREPGKGILSGPTIEAFFKKFGQNSSTHSYKMPYSDTGDSKTDEYHWIFDQSGVLSSRQEDYLGDGSYAYTTCFTSVSRDNLSFSMAPAKSLCHGTTVHASVTRENDILQHFDIFEVDHDLLKSIEAKDAAEAEDLRQRKQQKQKDDASSKSPRL